MRYKSCGLVLTCVLAIAFQGKVSCCCVRLVSFPLSFLQSWHCLLFFCLTFPLFVPSALSLSPYVPLFPLTCPSSSRLTKSLPSPDSFFFMLRESKVKTKSVFPLKTCDANAQVFFSPSVNSFFLLQIFCEILGCLMSLRAWMSGRLIES